MKLSDIQIISGRVEGGDWVDDLPRLPGLRVKVRGLRNTKYVELEQRLVSKLPRSRARRISPEDNTAILGACLAQTVLLDWDGLTDDSGQPLAFSAELAGKLLSDPQFSVFREAVVHAANEVGSATHGDDTDDEPPKARPIVANTVRGD